MDNLQYSRPIDVHRLSDYPEVQKMISYLLSLLKEAGLIKGSPRDKVLRHLKVVVLDLYVAYMRDPLVYVGYPRGSDAYAHGTRMRKLHLGLDSMKKVVAGLFSLGYLEHHVGFKDRTTGVGYFSRMRATSSLISLIQDYDIVTSMISRVDDDVIVLREQDAEDDSKAKRELVFDDTAEIVQMRQDLRSYNTFLQSHHLGMSLSVKEIGKILVSRRCPQLDITRNRLYRIFNGDFSSGGRFYRGWWQNIPRDLRKHITIDGEPCSELDYSCQHLLLLYARGEDEYRWLKGLDDDPYYLEKYGPEVRDLLKVAILILVNASDRNTAVRAIRQKINDDFPDIESTNAFIKPLINELMDKHPIVRQHFFSGTGGALQFQDSKIAEYVLGHMKARGQLVLPVHDSFVVQDKYIDNLYVTMIESYRMLVPDSVPAIKPKEGANTDPNRNSFKRLRERMAQEREENKTELEWIRKLDDFV